MGDQGTGFDAALHGERWPPLRLDPRQQKLVQALQAIDQKLARMYCGALRVLADPGNPDGHALAAHDLREVIGELPRRLPLPVPRDEKQTDEKARKKTRADEAADAARFFDPLAERMPTPFESSIVEEWTSAYDFFAGICHHGKEVKSDEEFAEHLARLEQRLLAWLAPSTSEEMSRIDAVVQQQGPPGPERVQQALELIRIRASNYKYFFDNLTCSEWIAPLAAEGLLQIPTPSAPEGNAAAFLWPPSRYLARMAPLSPELVCRTIEGMPATSNVWVHQDLVDAALKMPVAFAVRMAQKEVRWIRKQPHLYPVLPEKYGELCEYLAKEGEPHVSLMLARALLTVTMGGEERGGESESYWILTKHFPAVIRAAGLPAIEFLCDLLATAIARSGDTHPDEDYSYFWQRAIEDHEQNRGTGNVRNTIVLAIRNGLQGLVEEGRIQVDDALALLSQREYSIFKRLSLHLLVQYVDRAPGLAKKSTLNKEDFADHRIRHEYSRLLRAVFPRLVTDEQERVLAWVEEEACRLSAQEDEEHRGKREKCVVRDRLAALTGVLPAEWQKRYDNLVAELGEPTHPDFPVWMGATWVGPTSPKTADDLKVMTPQALADFLRTWNAPGGWQDPTPEGLARTLRRIVAEEPERHAAHIPLFQPVDPTYARSFIEGFSEAAKEDRVFDWRKVLEFALWIVAQPRDIPRRELGKLERDPDWGWARNSVAWMLEVAFAKNAILPDLRELAWQILHPLTDDLDPARDEESSGEPRSGAINSVRGVAMHAVVEYALWVHRNDASVRAIHPPLAAMPEVQDVLERHLNIEYDPSLAIRTVYGLYFPKLVFLDETWARHKIPVIFPRESDRIGYRNAAWDAYLFGAGRVYDDVFELLRGEYEHAVAKLGTTDREEQTCDTYRQLADHLMILVGRGQITVGGEGTLVERFFALATDSLQAHALASIGRWLGQEGTEFPQEWLGRYRALWDSRLRTMKENPAVHQQALDAFGWWFRSRKFPTDWSVRNLVEVTELAHNVDFDHEVLEQLVQMTDEFPTEGVRVVAGLAEGDRERWVILGNRDAIRGVLDRAEMLPVAAAQAKALREKLLAKGYLDFRRTSARA